MIISNVEIMGLDSSIVSSGYAMRTKAELHEVTEKDKNRAMMLTTASKECGAHGQFLTGIRVNMDIKFSNKAWVELERYRFIEFVTSQSTMHRICKFDIENQYNKYVDKRIIDIMKEKVNEYNSLENQISLDDLDAKFRAEQDKKNKYLQILYSNPAGFELTARVTTNYRCLLNVYNQRYNHRLPEWREFCEELLELPMFKEFLEAYNKEKTNEV